MEVKLVNLRKEFASRSKKGDTVIAVNDVNVTVPAGKLIGLLGPSGCGKSTTLYMIAGLYKPTSGAILFGDKDVTELPPEKRGIGLVFQNYALYPHLSVAENIMFPLLSRKEPKKLAYEKALEMAKLVGIEDYMDRKPAELSGGQQQRVAIARAIVKKPEVLLLDEPLSNLDARLRLQTREEIKRIQRETGITTIFVTHDQEEALSISDLIVVMCAGEVKQIGIPQEVYNEPENQFVAEFLGTPPINIIPAVYEDNEEKAEEPEKEEISSAEGISEDTEKEEENVAADGVLRFGDQIFLDDKTPAFGERMILTKDTRIGIRPEFFDVREDGKYIMHVERIDFIGRDKTIIFTLPGIEKQYKAIVPQETQLAENTDIHFNLKRYYIFDTIGRRVK